MIYLRKRASLIGLLWSKGAVYKRNSQLYTTGSADLVFVCNINGAFSASAMKATMFKALDFGARITNQVSKLCQNCNLNFLNDMDLPVTLIARHFRRDMAPRESQSHSSGSDASDGMIDPSNYGNPLRAPTHGRCPSQVKMDGSNRKQVSGQE